MAGFDNEVVYGTNVDFTGSSTVSAQVTTDGQLLIGSTTSPNIRVGTLSSSDNSITITNGAGTIDLKAAGIPVIRGPTVNFLATGPTSIFSTTGQFVLLGVVFTAISLTGVIGGFSADFGWTAPAYSDFASGVTNSLSTSNTTEPVIPAFTSNYSLIPAGVTFTINVTAADPTATSSLQRVDVLGYYL